MQLISVSVTAQIVRMITTNIGVLVFRTMGMTACLIGMQHRFSTQKFLPMLLLKLFTKSAKIGTLDYC